MNNDPTNDPDDQNLARWIRAAAPIGKPSAARREAAFKAVHDEWQAALQAGDQPDDRTADRPQTRLAPPSNRRGWSIAIAASLVLAISVPGVRTHWRQQGVRRSAGMAGPSHTTAVMHDAGCHVA